MLVLTVLGEQPQAAQELTSVALVIQSGEEHSPGLDARTTARRY